MTEGMIMGIWVQEAIRVDAQIMAIQDLSLNGVN